ncbi:hypothetical protein ACV07N_14845 [Roseivirga echinicomitans]
MKLKLTFLLCLLCSLANAQQVDLKKAPINPNPLEDLKYVLPKCLAGNVVYFMGAFYNKEGQRLDASGLPYTIYATTPEDKAKVLYKIFDVYDNRGNLTQHNTYNGTSKISINYEYDAKNNLTKRTNGNTVYNYHYDNENRFNKLVISKTTSDNSLTENISYEYNGDITIVTKNSIDDSGGGEKSIHTFKNGLLISEDFGPTVKNEFAYVFDNKGNWIERNYVSGTNKDRRAIVYAEELIPSSMKVRETNVSHGANAKPALTANGKAMTVNYFQSQANYIAYIPLTKTYYFAKDYYKESRLQGAEFSLVELPIKDNFVAAKIYGSSYQILLNGLPLPDLVKVSAPDYILFYDPNGNRYLQVTENPSDPYGFGTISEFKTDYLGYNNIAAQTGYFFNKGARDFLFGARPGFLENGDLLIYLDGKPAYVAKANEATLDMKIYMITAYNGEKIKQ